MHISYSREDAELVIRVQDAAHKASWQLSGVMSNQGGDWFEAWVTLLRKAAGVCVFFTEGNRDVLNNQGVGYMEKFVARMQAQGKDAALHREAMAILEVKAQRPDFKIYVVDGVSFLPEQLAFNLMNDAPSFGPVDKWENFITGGWETYSTHSQHVNEVLMGCE